MGTRFPEARDCYQQKQRILTNLFEMDEDKENQAINNRLVVINAFSIFSKLNPCSLFF